VYKHGQYTSVSAAARGDDFYSPAKPATYIELRLLPELAFYHNRIPTTSTARVVLTMGTFACAAAGAVLVPLHGPHTPAPYGTHLHALLAQLPGREARCLPLCCLKAHRSSP
jgi:hypothetical protein